MIDIFIICSVFLFANMCNKQGRLEAILISLVHTCKPVAGASSFKVYDFHNRTTSDHYVCLHLKVLANISSNFMFPLFSSTHVLWYVVKTQFWVSSFIVRRAGLLWSQQDFEWRWSVPLFKCLTVLEFSFILFDLCLLITFFNFIMNYVPIVTFWIFTCHKIWIL